MTWTDHWSILLSGTAASCIGLIGLFAVFWLTTRRDRALERIRRDLDRAAEQQHEQATAVARVYGAVVMQPKDLAFAPIYGNAQALELLSACIHLQAVIGTRHSDVARWVLRQHAQLLEARKAYWRVCLVPVLRRRPATAWGKALGEMGGALVEWQAGRLGDDWFANKLSSAPDRPGLVEALPASAGNSALSSGATTDEQLPATPAATHSTNVGSARPT